MIRQIAPLFFTTDIPTTLAYYKDKLGFECLGEFVVEYFLKQILESPVIGLENCIFCREI